MRAVAKVNVGKSGGAAHTYYITRHAALRLNEQERAEREPDTPERAASERDEAERRPVGSKHEQTALARNAAGRLHAGASGDEERQPRRAARRRSERDIDPLWTINAPEFVIGEVALRPDRRSAAGAGGRDEQPAERGTGAGERSSVGDRNTPADLPFDERRRRALAHFVGLVTYEEQAGGVSHYRFMLAVAAELTNRDLRDISESFFRQVAPTAQVLVAVHRNTDDAHLHGLMPSRGVNGRRIAFGQEFFHLDERWMERCAERLGAREIADEHLRLKLETLEYKRGVREDIREGREPRAKPDRWSDHWEVWHGRSRPFDDYYVGRVRATAETARIKDRFLRVTEAPEDERRQAADERQTLQDKLARLEDRRADARSVDKHKLPRPIYTVAEQTLVLLYRRELTRIKEVRQQEQHRRLDSELIERTGVYLDKLEVKRGAGWAYDERQLDETTTHLSRRWEQVLGEKSLTLADAGHTAETLRARVADLVRAAAADIQITEHKRRATEESERRARDSNRTAAERADRYFAEVERGEGELWAFDPERVAVHERELRSIHTRAAAEHDVAADQLDENELTRVVEERMGAEIRFAQDRLAGRAGRAEAALLLHDARRMTVIAMPSPNNETHAERREREHEREQMAQIADRYGRLCREHGVERAEVRLTEPERQEMSRLLPTLDEQVQSVITRRLRPDERRGLLAGLLDGVRSLVEHTPREQDHRAAHVREQEYGWYSRDDTQPQTKERQELDRGGRSR